MITAFDSLYRHIEFEPSELPLIQELLSCPEVLRLKKMRLLNFDSLLFQDLASANRLSHSIGVAFLASQLSRFASSKIEAQTWIAAALLHDIGILPFGHLIEASLKRRTPSFSHEGIVLNILRGTYHPSNIYHQILPGQSLQVANTLIRHGIDTHDVARLILPASRRLTMFNGPLDLDNLDNVHRMAALLGINEASDNVRAILSNLRIIDSQLAFEPQAVPALEKMYSYRQQIYATMIAHPVAVPYNALLSDLADELVDGGRFSADDWFASDAKVKESISELRSVASRAYATERCYQLKDYIWVLREKWWLVG